MTIELPQLSLVVMIGASGSGKSSFARRHFRPTEVLSSDYCRGLVSDNENDQAATNEAFAVLHFIAATRLRRGKLTVIDATNVQVESRKPLVALAREHDVLPVAIVFNLPEKICLERNTTRPDRSFGPHVVRQQRQQLRRSLRGLGREGFRHVFVFDSAEEVDAAVVQRTRLWNDRRDEHGPFDIIGDVHGCCDELLELLTALGYEVVETRAGTGLDSGPIVRHPSGRTAVFLGDLADRGPRSLDVLRLVRNMVAGKSALCVPGNHDVKLMRKFRGRDVQVTHGLDRTLAEFDAVEQQARESLQDQAAEFIDSLVSHYVLDEGKLVVAHAGMKEQYQGRASGRVREFALYAETTGETDEFGLPVRLNWAAEYRGGARVVYGHTPVPEAEWLNRTMNIDTGCVFGGKLTALRYPEMELVSVPARATYSEPRKPFLPPETAVPAQSVQQLHDDVLDLSDVLGKRIVTTRHQTTVTVREEHACAALEVMSRFAINPKWLIYLPPTMSPVETAKEGDLLEHPAQSFAYYRLQGIGRVVCEEKHMGSRAVIVICRDQNAACQRFGVVDEGIGACYTRTGRRFFSDPGLERQFLDRLCSAMTESNFWEQYATTWACLDCELMPWSAKAQALLREQYAAVGSASRAALSRTVEVLEEARRRNENVTPLAAQFTARRQMAEDYVVAYRRYCWSVQSLADYRLAPFHLLATEGHIHCDHDHLWHMDSLAAICRCDPSFLLATVHRVLDVTDPDAEAAAIQWWFDLTGQGGEGMVVKPLEFMARGRRGWVQPAVKCRGREYLRIIYGPEYTAPEHLERLRSRGLGAKRSLAMREFLLGIEGLERFVRREPLRRVHECVFAVLALESEPVDPRL